MKDEETIVMLIFFGCTYCLLFTFAYWFFDSVNAVQVPTLKEQGVEHQQVENAHFVKLSL